MTRATVVDSEAKYEASLDEKYNAEPETRVDTSADQTLVESSV